MTQEPRGERLFRAWGEVSVPFDEASGLARFLEAARRKRRSSRTRWGLLAAAALASCVVAFVVFRAPSPLRFSVPSGEGRVGAWLATSKTSEMPLTFSDGTKLMIAADSRGRVEQVDPAGARFLLERGEVQANVVHRSRSRWQFLAGPFEVEVTGTKLGVDWDPTSERLAVWVDEGSVRVHGPHLGALKEVRAGERCVVELSSQTMHLATAQADAGSDGLADAGSEPDASTEPRALPSLSPSVTRRGARPSLVPWTVLEEKGDYDGAYASAMSSGLSSVLRAASADELLRFALVAQLSGHPDAEHEALLSCRQRFPKSDQAALSAYQLGRRASPSEAARWFEVYLDEQPTGQLAREALGRVVEARAASGDEAVARKAAARYLAQFPSGPHASIARRILSDGVGSGSKTHGNGAGSAGGRP